MAVDLTRFDPKALSELPVATVGGARHTLLSNQDFRLQSVLLETPLGGIIHGRYLADMRVQQTVPRDRYFIGLIFGVRGSFTADGIALSGGDMVLFPPGSEVGAVMKASVEWAILSVSPEVLRVRADRLVGPDRLPATPGMRLISDARSGPIAARRVFAVLSDLHRLNAANGLTSTDAEAARDWVEAALETFLDAPAFAPGDRLQPRSYATFRRVEEYLEAQAHRPIYMHELCAAAGVSGRQIRLVFNDTIGMPPERYLQLIRLHRARELLPGAQSVKYAALSTGNTHLSRFSQHYAHLFGERPNDTFRREHVDVH